MLISKVVRSPRLAWSGRQARKSPERRILVVSGDSLRKGELIHKNSVPHDRLVRLEIAEVRGAAEFAMRIAAHFPDEIFTVSSCPLSYGDKHDVWPPLPLAQGIGSPRQSKKGAP